MEDMIFVSYVFKADEDLSNKYVLIVPDLGTKSMVMARSRKALFTKILKRIHSLYSSNELKKIKPHTEEYFTEVILEKYNIPKEAISFKVAIPITLLGKKKEKFKRISASISPSLDDKINRYIKHKNMTRSEFLAIASKRYLNDIGDDM